MNQPIGDIRQGIFQDLFGSAIKEKGRVNLIYARLNVRPEEIFKAEADRIGAQQSRGAVAAAGQITDLHYSAFSGTSRGVKELGSGKMSGSTVRAFMGDANRLGQFTTYDTESRQNVVMAWDAYTLRLMSQRGLPGSPANGTERSGFVDVKKIAREVFDDLGDWNDNIGSLPKFRENINQRLQGSVERGSSLSYIKQSLEATGKELSDLTDDQLTETVFNAAYLKAKDQGRLGQIRQLMYRGGVRNLDNIVNTIEDPVDPLGIANKFSSAVKGKGAFYSGGPGSNLPGFIKSVSEVSGEEYAYEQLMPFMNKLYQNDKLKGLSFMLTDQGELYAGQGQVWNTYKPIPLEVLGARSVRDEAGKVTGYTGDVSMRGMPRGMMIIGESNRLAKKQIVDGKVVPASQVALGAFAEGALEPYEGLKEGNIEVALATGFNRARKSWDPLLSATISRGMPSTVGSLATSYSAHDPAAYSEFRDAIVGIAGDVGAMRDISANRKKMFESIARYRGSDIPGVSDQHAFVKPKDFSVPLEGIEDFAFPGSLSSTEEKKGIYHRLKPAEITDAGHIARIKAGVASLTGGTLRANSIGQFSGDFRALVAGQESLQGLLGERTGRQGANVVTKFTMPTLYLASDSPSIDKFRQQRVTFGEPTIETTPLGRSMFEDILRPTTTYDAKMSRGKLANFLNAISDSGDYRDVEGLNQIYQSLTGEGPKGKTREHFGQGIEIDSAARKRLRNAGFKVPYTRGNYAKGHKLLLNYASYQEWDKQAHFGFMTRTTPGSFSLVHAGQRVTAMNPIESRFSEFNDYAAAVTGVETLSSQNRVNSMFSHRTALTELAGGPEAFAKHYRDVAEELNRKVGSTTYDPELIQYKTDKEGLGYLVPKAGLKDDTAPEQFEVVSRQALNRMGVSNAAIEGQAKAIAKLRGLDPSVFSDSDKILYDQSMMRIGETELLSNQAKGLRPRLEILRRIGRGSIGATGIKPKDNPAFMEMALAWQESTGFRFSQQFLETGAHGVSSLIDYGVGPQGTHLKAINALLKGTDAVKKISKERNIPIISAEEAYKLFVSGEHGVSISAETGQEGILTSKLTNSALFSDKFRPENMKKGVFVDVGQEHIAPLLGQSRGPNQAEPFVSSRYLFVPGTDSSLSKFWHVSAEEPDIPQRLPVESLERNVLGALSSLKNKPGEQGVTKGTFQGYFADTYRALARYTTPQGKLKQAAHVGKSMKDAARFRLVPRADITDTASIAKSLEPTEEMFTVGISKGDLFKVVGNNKKRYQEALAAFDEKGFYYGGMFPSPTHAAQHLSVVKYKLMESLADVGETEPRAMVEGFLAWKMNRDNDQDTVQGFLKRRFKDQSKWEDAFREQLKSSLPEYKQYRLEVEQAYKDAVSSGYDKPMQEFLPGFIQQHRLNSMEANKVANKLKYMSFGSTPPIAFAGEWSSFSLAGAFASDEGNDVVATQLNKMLRGLNAFKNNGSFSAGDIARYRSALGPNPQEAFSVATLLQQNMLQGFISKGGAYQDAMFEFENLPFRIAQGVDSGKMTLEQAKEEGVRSVRTLFDLMSGEGKSKLRLPGKKFVDMSDDQARQVAAETLGSVYGVGLFAHAEKITPNARRSGNFDPVRIGEKSKEGNLQNLAMSQGEAIEASRIGKGLIPTSQKMITEANKATNNKGATAGAEAAAGSETLKKGGQWLKDNWKLVAAGAAALVGLRALNSAFGDEELKRPSLKSSAALAFGNAPLPPEPMVGRNQDGPQMRRQEAYVQPPNSQYSNTRYNGSFSSVNSNELMAAIRVSPFAANQGTVNLVDSRSYKSNWELQTIADQVGNSDFIYNGMGTV